jgi:hypothetical protein
VLEGMNSDISVDFRKKKAKWYHGPFYWNSYILTF